MRRGVARRTTGALSLLVPMLLAVDAASGATGDLSALGCLSGDAITTAVCTQLPDANPGGEDSGLDEPQSIDVSPNGQSVYVTSQQDDAIVHLERNPITGTLTFADCITGDTASGPSGTGACAAAPTTNANGVNTGFNNPSDAVLSNNGAWLYMASQEDDAVARFSRDLTTGSLTFVDCVTGNTGVTPCTAISTATANGDASGIARPSGIAISPGGTSIYVTSNTDDAIAWFARTPMTGVIAYDDCISAETATAAASCIDANDFSPTGDGTGLDTPFSPVVSDDGDAVYVSSNNDASVAWFNRAGNGDLTWNDCITGDLDSAPSSPAAACGTALATATAIGDGGNSGMERIQTIVISPDDGSLYSGSQTDQAVIHFSRNAATEDLTFEECLSGDAGLCGDVPPATPNGANSGLEFLQALAISPDGKSVYAAGSSDAAITTFDRDLATGDLTWNACVTGELESVSASCVASDATTGATGSGLAGPYSLAVTPDGLGLVGSATIDAAVISAVRSNAPETAIDSRPATASNDQTASFGFSADEPGVTFECKVDAGAFGACSGVGSHTTGPLPDGAHTFEVRAVNDAASPDLTPATDSFTVDTIAPDAQISAGPDGLIANGNVQFEFSAAGGASELQCRMDGAPFAACTSPKSFTLGDGSHTFEVRAEDAAGNVDASPASRTFRIDSVQPDTSITTAPKKTVKTRADKKKAKFRFITTEAATFECKRDKGKEFKPCSAPYAKKYKRGKHTFTVRAIDEAGNVGKSDSHTWKVKRKK